MQADNPALGAVRVVLLSDPSAQTSNPLSHVRLFLIMNVIYFWVNMLIVCVKLGMWNQVHLRERLYITHHWLECILPPTPLPSWEIRVSFFSSKTLFPTLYKNVNVDFMSQRGQTPVRWTLFTSFSMLYISSLLYMLCYMFPYMSNRLTSESETIREQNIMNK